MDTYNTPISKSGPTCSEQLFQSVPTLVDDGDIIGYSLLLTSQAKSLCTLLAIDGENGDTEFIASHETVVDSLNGITGILEQLQAVLSHNYVASGLIDKGPANKD